MDRIRLPWGPSVSSNYARTATIRRLNRQVRHTLVVPDDCSEMITLFTVHGALMYVDSLGNATGYDDVFTRIERYRAHFEAAGLGADHVRRSMR